MGTRSKKPIWLLFKMMELLAISINAYVHVDCFHSKEIPHIFILCATYGGGLIIGSMNLLGTLFTDRLPAKMEALVSGIMGFMCLVAVYANMFLAEHDKLLAFLKHREENDYAFLMCCHNNGILSLCAVGIHFLHCTFALDMLITHSPSMIATLPDGSTIALQSQRSKRPLKMYFISKGVELWLMKFRWFQLLSTNIFNPKEKQLSTYTYDTTQSELSIDTII